MGRKIPGAKHRGIKDPAKQHAQRWAELKTKINNPPKNIDDQAIPKSLERVMNLKNAVKSGKIPLVKKRSRNKAKNKLIKLGSQNYTNITSKSKPEKSVPVFNQKPGENKRVFWNRVNRETQHFINETTFEKKYDVQIKRDPESGEVMGVEKRAKDEIDELMKLKMKHKNVGKKKKKIIEPKLSKAQKKKQKLDIKKAKKSQNDVDEFKPVRERVEFGDIVHAPPELNVKPSKADKIINKPANKNLLLYSLLQKDGNHNSKPIDKTGKRKHLPAAERRILDQQQNDVIEAYKLLKARKSHEN
ncbi:hypothetical protein PV325_012636 [Microctonus aethiopoides]|uniref:Coiled-coil domain-containing protein 137 n=1 Tax=Microctonus aethiopoides TaxID=144406 RepID=A0AA39FP11_9HYME|nr:hypothetical protein PV325_012636 [Microctonus aethiopoides]KAK0173043.1 hypothetical protein PV328_006297 [Microctonus aethiopoides]